MEHLQYITCICGTMFYALSILLFVKYTRFAKRVHQANIRTRYKALGYGSSAVGLSLSALFFLVGSLSWALWTASVTLLIVAQPIMF